MTVTTLSLAALALGVVLAGGIARADDGSDALAAITAAAPGCDATRAHCLGLRLHVVVDGRSSLPAGSVAEGRRGVVNEHGAVATPAWVADELAAIDRHYAPLDLAATITAIDALPAELAHVATRADRDTFLPRADGVRTGVIDVFVVAQLDDVDRADGIIHGVTWRRGGRVYIIIAASAKPRTLAHELGHVFGLPHSTYAISIMNKTPRDDPPDDQRTFADEEIAAMRPTLVRMRRAHVIVDQK